MGLRLLRVMMTSSNRNIFRVTGHLCREFTGLRWIPRTKASDAELWYLGLNKQLSKQSRGWWFETLSCPLWRQCNGKGFSCGLWLVAVAVQAGPSPQNVRYSNSNGEHQSRGYQWVIYRRSLINYSDIIMDPMVSQITGVSVVCSIVCSGGDQRIHQSSASKVLVRTGDWWPVNSPHKGTATRKMFPFDDAIARSWNNMDRCHLVSTPWQIVVQHILCHNFANFVWVSAQINISILRNLIY